MEPILSSDDSQNDFIRRMRVVAWVTLILPPVTGILMLSFVGVFPFPEVLFPFTDYAAIVVACGAFIGLKISKSYTNDMLFLRHNPELQEKYQVKLKRLPLYYFSLLFIYFAFGLVSTLYSLSTLYGYNYPLSKYFISFLGVIPGALITALPIFFYLTDALGRFLAPHGIDVSVAPIKLKLIVLGLFIPILIDTLLIMYFYDRTGYLSIETVGIWFFLIVIAAIGTFMAWNSFRISLSPFVLTNDIDNYNHNDIHIVPQSLDELGVLSKQWHELWLRVFEYETQLTNSNSLLRDDVQQRTHELESERILVDTLLTNAGALIIVLDRNGHVIRFNPASERATGFLFDKIKIKPIWEWLIPPEQIDSVKNVFNELRENGLESTHENEIMTKEGKRLLISWNNVGVKDDEGNVKYVIAIGIDISERQIIQKSLEDAIKLAEKNSNAKSEFLSRMSHELRTPMNAIMGFAQLIERDVDTNNSKNLQADFAQEIINAGGHLLSLINEVLDLSRIEQGDFDIHLEPTDLCKLINESISLLKPQAKENNISLSHTMSEDNQCLVQADQLRLKQVFINLLSNAIKYNIQGGTVEIILTVLENNMMRVSLKDTGEGITEDMRERLFMPFERLSHNNDETIEGTGIGLALSKRMIELMKGNIGVSSVPSEGSTFYFDIPYLGVDDKTDSMRDDIKKITHSAVVSNIKYKVLYVEDNPQNIRFMSAIFESRKDIELIVAHNGRLGLELAFVHSFDLILLDINLPGMSGLEVHKKLRLNNKTANLPIVAISANAMQRDIDVALSDGFNDYLVKPLDVNNLMNMLKQYLPTK